MEIKNFDVIIVGGGPAGLSAALILGRCRRSVLVIDAHDPRNAASHAAHGFFSRDGVNPAQLLSEARSDLQNYDNVSTIDALAVGAATATTGFSITVDEGLTFTGRKLLIATGVVDRLPNFNGFDKFYGTSIHPCPYCDGWEHRDTPIAVYGKGEKGAGLASMMLQWSDCVTLCTDGPTELSGEETGRLADQKIQIVSRKIARVEGNMNGALARIVFVDGGHIDCRAMFTALGVEPRLTLFKDLGCHIENSGSPAVAMDTCETSIRGVYAAGDASRDLWLVLIAAAEGAKAAIAINKAL